VEPGERRVFFGEMLRLPRERLRLLHQSPTCREQRIEGFFAFCVHGSYYSMTISVRSSTGAPSFARHTMVLVGWRRSKPRETQPRSGDKLPR
jgi:hypothetical protein